MISTGTLDLKHLFLNANAGLGLPTYLGFFDDSKFPQYLENLSIEANIHFNKRNGTGTDREEYFDEVSYKERFTCEHPFA
jgi:hypothetical protein